MTLDIDTTRARLRDTETKYPIPAWDSGRLDQRTWVLKHAKPHGIGMEVGVFRGCFSERICKIAKPRKLYLVDPWTTMGETFGWGKEYTCFGTLPTAVARDEAAMRVSMYPDTQVKLIEGTFPKCSDQIEEPLDWAYLDASHKYAPTLNELRSLDKMVAEGGTILGDDWNPDPDHIHYGVYKAVTEFVKSSDWNIIKAGQGSQWALRRGV